MPKRIQTPVKKSPQKQVKAEQLTKPQQNPIEVSINNISPQIKKKTPVKL